MILVLVLFLGLPQLCRQSPDFHDKDLFALSEDLNQWGAGNTTVSRKHLTLEAGQQRILNSVCGPRRYLTARLGSGPFDMTGEEVLRVVIGTEPITTKPSTLFVTSNGVRGLRKYGKEAGVCSRWGRYSS
ncbi:hypothetical protein [Paradesertivirga mongoliensis]|uniref:hypothetical protein n=1 Tax=Paradesertivirga mongoliensis TaxID=2100740 RepID=UPI00210E3CBC|nr:hypothetical protein [Pedobacter mongoliensis]